ncbi:MAG: WD40 repeat domain-containing protein [Pirellulaceae bacterium]|nr:WD40 repeat domain-containing protein [Pirellulaceae bacterium]
MVRVHCPTCKHRFELQGQGDISVVLCPRCSAELKIPEKIRDSLASAKKRGGESLDKNSSSQGLHQEAVSSKQEESDGGDSGAEQVDTNFQESLETFSPDEVDTVYENVAQMGQKKGSGGELLLLLKLAALVLLAASGFVLGQLNERLNVNTFPIGLLLLVFGTLFLAFGFFMKTGRRLDLQALREGKSQAESYQRGKRSDTLLLARAFSLLLGTIFAALGLADLSLAFPLVPVAPTQAELAELAAQEAKDRWASRRQEEEQRQEEDAQNPDGRKGSAEEEAQETAPNEDEANENGLDKKISNQTGEIEEQRLEILRPLLPFTGHGGPVNSAMFSTDGKKMLLAASDHNIVLWNATRRSVEYHLTNEEGLENVYRFLRSHNRQTVFTSDQNKDSQYEFAVWDMGLAVPGLKHTFKKNSTGTPAQVVTNSGEYVAGADVLGNVYFWNQNGSRKKVRLQKPALAQHSSLAFSPDDQFLVATFAYDRGTYPPEPGEQATQGSETTSVPEGGYRPTLYLFDVAQGELVHSFELRGDSKINSQGAPALGYAHSLAFSPRGRFLATGHDGATAGEGGLVAVWDWSQGELLATFSGHEGSVEALTFADNGRYLVSGSSDETVRVWDLQTKKEIFQTEVVGTPLRQVDISPDGSYLLGHGRRKELWLWGLPYYENSSVDSPLVDRPDPGDRRVVGEVPVKKESALWPKEGESVASVRHPRELDGHTGGLSGIVFMERDKNQFLSASTDGGIFRWDLENDEKKEELFKPSAAPVLSIYPSSDGQRIMTFRQPHRQDGLLTLYNWQREKLRQVWSEPLVHEIRSLALSPKGDQLAVSYQESPRQIEILNATTLRPASSYRRSGEVDALLFHPKKDLLFAAVGQKIEIFDAALGLDNKPLIWTAKESPLPQEGRLFKMALSDEGDFFAAIFKRGSSQMVGVWEVATGQMVLVIPRPAAALSSLAFSKGNKELFVGDTEGVITAYDLTEKLLVRRYYGHTGEVDFLRVSPDGDELFSASHQETDTKVRIWPLND